MQPGMLQRCCLGCCRDVAGDAARDVPRCALAQPSSEIGILSLWIHPFPSHRDKGSTALSLGSVPLSPCRAGGSSLCAETALPLGFIHQSCPGMEKFGASIEGFGGAREWPPLSPQPRERILRQRFCRAPGQAEGGRSGRRKRERRRKLSTSLLFWPGAPVFTERESFPQPSPLAPPLPSQLASLGADPRANRGTESGHGRCVRGEAAATPGLELQSAPTDGRNPRGRGGAHPGVNTARESWKVSGRGDAESLAGVLGVR